MIMKRPDYLTQVEKRIENDPHGTVYVSSDFTDITDKSNVSVILSRLEEKGLITRAIRGVYYKQRYSEILGKNTGPYLEQVAKAIARNNGWTIVVNGDSALNGLGISTQVPVVWEFASDGPTKTYYYKDIPIYFKHVSKKDITGLSFMTAYVIQALKALGKKNVNERVIGKLSSVLTNEQKKTMLAETKNCSYWIRETIVLIAQEKTASEGVNVKNTDCLAQIEKRIKKDPYDTVYVSSDFTDITDKSSVSKILSRLEKKGLIRRVIRGVYYKHEFFELIGDYTVPDLNDVAKAIARNNGWTIVPCGNQALNDLGLSTQVPAKYVFMTDGPTKTYYYEGIPIYFKHIAQKDITGLSFMTAYVILALKTLGKEYVDDKVIRKLSYTLTEEQKKTMLAETKNCASWIRETIVLVNREKADEKITIFKLN